MTAERLKPASPVHSSDRYTAHAANGALLAELHLPAGCYSPVIPGVAYYVPSGASRADC